MTHLGFQSGGINDSGVSVIVVLSVDHLILPTHLCLTAWKVILRQRFQKDRGANMLRADNLGQTLSAEDKFSPQEYIDRKLSLYNETGEMDEDA
ncbi:hypothetical protein ACHAQJ_006851 [Trichoderma viride]